MALTFGAVNTDRVVLATSTSLDTFSPMTLALWVYPTTLTSGRIIMAKSGGLHILHLSGTSGNVELRIDRATTDLTFITNDTPLATLNKWYFVAAVVDTSAGAGQQGSIYVGSLTALAVESAYGTATDGVGTVTANALAWGIGNRGGGTQNLAWEGAIAFAGFWARAMTLGEIRSQQYAMRNTVDCQLFTHLGYNGTGTQVDLSGNNIGGTVTGATVSAHVPLAAPWGFGTEWHGGVTGPQGADVVTPRISMVNP